MVPMEFIAGALELCTLARACRTFASLPALSGLPLQLRLPKPLCLQLLQMVAVRNCFLEVSVATLKAKVCFDAIKPLIYYQ